MKTNWRGRLLTKTMLAGATGPLLVAAGLISAPAAFAQETVQTTPAGPAAETQRETIVVTGSRIARQDYVANSPIVTVDTADIEATGVATLDTLLTQMPQFVPAINATSNNPSNGGQANVSLRGLGTRRTLVLMNGRRIVPATEEGIVDINLIPAQLVGNIEVISGGASATYGSDALAGVVNFILRDFEGLEVQATYGVTDEEDAYTKSLSMATGGSFADGRGQASLMVSYNYRDGIYNRDRAFSAISGPSGASPLGNTIFDTNNLPTTGAISAAVPGAVPTNTFGFNNNNTLFAYQGRRDFVSPGGITYDGFAQPGPTFNPDFSYNTGALNLLVIPQERYNAYAQASYDVTDNIELYTDFLFTEYETNQELAASPAAGSTTGFRVPVSNPFIPTELATVLASRPNPLGSFLLDKRFVALGPRFQQFLYDAYQGTVGARGELGFYDWTYDVYTSYGRVNRTDISNGNVSRSAVQRLLNATDGGASLCDGGFDWFGETTLSASCAAFINREAKNLRVNEQINAEAVIQGRGFELPAGEQRIALGINYREDTYSLRPDTSLSALVSTQPCIATAAYPGSGPALPQSACSQPTTIFPATPFQPGLTQVVNGVTGPGNDIAGFNALAAFSGTTDVYEVFAETLIPLLADLPAIQELNLTLAGRISDYSTVGQVEAYKADLEWKVVDALRLRGGFQRAVRAPSVGELFQPAVINFPNIGQPTTTAGAPQLSGDPCDTRSRYRSTAAPGGVGNLAASTNAQVTALCVAQGVAASAINSYTYTNQQVPGVVGGNPGLTQETADTWSVGVVLESPFENPYLANLRASIDYYNIEITDVIGTVSPSLAIQLCYNSNGTSNPTYDPTNFFCGLFERNPLNGNIINAQELNENLATANTSGVDFQVDWFADVGPGRLDLSWIGSWLESYETQSLPGGAFTDFTGTIGNRGTLGATVAPAFPEWKWLATANYTWGPARFGARWQHIGQMENFNARTDEIPAIGYFDLLASYDLTDNLSLRFNVNNVLNEQPPVYTPSVASNTDPSTYDVLGRRYTIGLTARF
jgi:iron complex outermembrane recepter protein